MDVAEFLDRTKHAPKHEIIIVLADGQRLAVEHLGEAVHASGREVEIYVKERVRIRVRV